MCDYCHGGVISDDEYGSIYCENCLLGLDSAIAEIVAKIAQFGNIQRQFESREDTYRADCAQMCVDSLKRESVRLEILRDAMTIPDPALAWASRSPQVREQVATLAVLEATR